jgi:hypothetical protein
VPVGMMKRVCDRIFSHLRFEVTFCLMGIFVVRDQESEARMGRVAEMRICVVKQLTLETRHASQDYCGFFIQRQKYQRTKVCQNNRSISISVQSEYLFEPNWHWPAIAAQHDKSSADDIPSTYREAIF